VNARPITSADGPALREFFSRIPEGDLTFFREDVLAPGVIDRWLEDDSVHRFAAEADDGSITGYLAVLPEVAWSSHVAQLRLIVDPSARGQGIGRGLARFGLLEALKLGITKLVVEVVAEQEGVVAVFTGLGFEAEGILKDHVRSRHGELHDLLILSHFVDKNWETMQGAGIDDLVS
jgi:GNAT superfamily N-acetyltransferase